MELNLDSASPHPFHADSLSVGSEDIFGTPQEFHCKRPPCHKIQGCPKQQKPNRPICLIQLCLLRNCASQKQNMFPSNTLCIRTVLTRTFTLHCVHLDCFLPPPLHSVSVSANSALLRCKTLSPLHPSLLQKNGWVRLGCLQSE